MLKFKKVFSCIISLFILFSFLSVCLAHEYLRVPVGEKNTYDQLQYKMYENGWVPVDEKAPKIPKEGGIVKEAVDLRTEPAGTIIYFDSKGQRIDYTIEICGNGIIKLWLNHKKGCHMISWKALESFKWADNSISKTPGIINSPGILVVPYFRWSKGKLMNAQHPDLIDKISGINFQSFKVFSLEAKTSNINTLFGKIRSLVGIRKNL